MPKTITSNTIPQCSSNVLKMIGDYWTLHIIQILATGAKRFGELEREVIGINPATLTNRLKKLEIEKIVKREEETLDRLSVVYMLTNRGQGMLPVLHEIQHFSQKFLH